MRPPGALNPLPDTPDDPGVDAREFERMAAAADPAPAGLGVDRLSRFRTWLGTERVRSVALAMGAVAAALLVATGLYLWASPRPDAVLRLTEPSTGFAGHQTRRLRAQPSSSTTRLSSPTSRSEASTSIRAQRARKPMPSGAGALDRQPPRLDVRALRCREDPVVYIYDVPIFGGEHGTSSRGGCRSRASAPEGIGFRVRCARNRRRCLGTARRTRESRCRREGCARSRRV